MLKPSSSKGEKMAELTITAIAREAGVRPSTLRYYEKVGLLPSARRVAGRRRYDVCALKRLELIAYAKRAGFSLESSIPSKIKKGYFSMFLGLLPAPFVTWTIAASTVAAMFVRPRRIPEAVWACLGAGLLLALHLVPFPGYHSSGSGCAEPRDCWQKAIPYSS
jgi:hypothetical protein